MMVEVVEVSHCHWGVLYRRVIIFNSYDYETYFPRNVSGDHSKRLL